MEFKDLPELEATFNALCDEAQATINRNRTNQQFRGIQMQHVLSTLLAAGPEKESALIKDLQAQGFLPLPPK